jgi:hypothetical protein
VPGAPVQPFRSGGAACDRYSPVAITWRARADARGGDRHDGVPVRAPRDRGNLQAPAPRTVRPCGRHSRDRPGQYAIAAGMYVRMRENLALSNVASSAARRERRRAARLQQRSVRHASYDIQCVPARGDAGLLPATSARSVQTAGSPQPAQSGGRDTREDARVSGASPRVCIAPPRAGDQQDGAVLRNGLADTRRRSPPSQ